MYTLVEHSLQRRYFAFLFVQGFIVATLGSGIMASINQIVNSPTSTVQLLAQNLPKASIFFLTLVITSGLSGAAGMYRNHLCMNRISYACYVLSHHCILFSQVASCKLQGLLSSISRLSCWVVHHVRSGKIRTLCPLHLGARHIQL